MSNIEHAHERLDYYTKRVRNASSERIIAMMLYRAIDTWCEAHGRAPVQLLNINAASSIRSGWMVLHCSVQTSTPTTVQSALRDIAPLWFDPARLRNPMAGYYAGPAPTPLPWELENHFLQPMANVDLHLRAASTFSRWWTLLLEGLPAYYAAYTGRTTWSAPLRNDWEKLKNNSVHYAALSHAVASPAGARLH